MPGGLIRVAGSAGNAVGGALSGSVRGMTGGTILVAGDAGDEVGRRMRRGLIAIGGRAGDLLGNHMLAGTIVLLGDCGLQSGYGMKRGTILLLGTTPPIGLTTFRSAGPTGSPVLPLVGRYLQTVGFVRDLSPFQADCELLHGDFLESGRGEIFCPAVSLCSV